MICTNAERGYLVVAQGTSDPYEIECVRDAAYEAELIERAAAMHPAAGHAAGEMEDY